MEDLTALAVRLSQSVGDARGVLILSRDGLVLGAHPADAEQRLKAPWLSFASLGEPERGFVQFGGEIWSYVRRGAYTGFVVTGPGVRPGFVLDQIEIALLSAEEARARREGLRAEPPTGAAAPTGKPRTPLHPEARPETPVVIRAEAQPAAPPREAAPVAPSAATSAVRPGPPATPSAPPPAPTPSRPPTPAEAEGSGAEPGAEAAAPPVDAPRTAGPERAPAATPWGSSSEEPEEPEEDEEIDRFSLAREFSQLLQERDAGADG